MTKFKICQAIGRFNKFEMGAENSILENCKWGDVIPTSSETDWSLRLASLKDESTVTVFRHKRKDRKEVDLLQRATKVC